MPYYDIFIGGTKCKLYLSDEPYKVYMAGDRKREPYGQLSYTFDEAEQAFKVRIDWLSDRGRYLMENGHLFVTATCQECGNMSPSKSHRGNKNVRRKVALKYHPRWFYRNPTYGDQVTNLSEEFWFYVDDIYPPKTVRKLTYLREWHNDTTETYFNARFYLFTDRDVQRRFLKTISEPFRLIVQ